MTHILCTIHQADSVERLINELEDDQAVLTIDYKQKIAPISSYRESQQNYFGKRGMCWHGSDEQQKVVRVHYFDYIIENDTVQDFTSVACCLESAIDCMKKQFLFIKRVSLRVR